MCNSGGAAKISTGGRALALPPPWLRHCQDPINMLFDNTTLIVDFLGSFPKQPARISTNKCIQAFSKWHSLCIAFYVS